MRIAQVLAEAERRLGSRKKASILLQHFLDVDAAGLIVRSGDQLPSLEHQRFRQLVNTADGKSVYRVIGEREFHGLPFGINDATLEPRDDTESLIDLVFEILGGRGKSGLRFADLGTGSGIVALVLLFELPNAIALATDIAPDALDQAVKNANRLGLAKRFETISGSSNSWTGCLKGTFDFIVSNPPYIATQVVEDLDTMVQLYDPMLALDGGEDGLDAYRDILANSPRHLKAEGFLALEIGYDQKASVTELALSLGWKLIGERKDLGGNDRALAFSR